MNPLERVLQLESQLDAGTISVEEACAAVFKAPRHWHTAWWKAQRKKRLGTVCATCGSTGPPLVLQHTWQPISWDEALERAGPPNWNWWKEHHPITNRTRSVKPVASRPVCPHCGSIAVRHRTRTNDWVCQTGQGGKPHERHPEFTFAEPRFELRTDNLAIRRLNAADRAKYDQRWEAWCRSPEHNENRRRALLIYLQDSKRYLSLMDTKTLCRPCAAREDHLHIRRKDRQAVELKQRERAQDELAWFDNVLGDSPTEGD